MGARFGATGYYPVNRVATFRFAGLPDEEGFVQTIEALTGEED